MFIKQLGKPFALRILESTVMDYENVSVCNIYPRHPHCQ